MNFATDSLIGDQNAAGAGRRIVSGAGWNNLRHRAAAGIAVLGLLLLIVLTLVAPPMEVVDGQRLVCREQVRQADLDRDGIPECYRLSDFRMTVTEGGATIWQSPADWWVTQFVLADSTNNGVTELNMVVWRQGNYGVYRPFWIRGADTEFCNHLYIFTLYHHKIWPVWMSSKIEHPIERLRIYDADGDGRNELVVSEERPLTGMPARVEYDDSGGLTYWRWQIWGFVRVPPPK